MTEVREALSFRMAPSHEAYTGIVCRIDGDKVSEDSFQWEPGHPVYTDGSCKYVTDPRLAISAAAAVQVLPNGGTRTVTTDITRDRPQSAVFAEHVALFLAAYYNQNADTGVQVVADCQAVIDGFRQTPSTQLNYRAKLGGFWMQVHDHAADIIKVKSHQSPAQASARGEGHLWHGNWLADLKANEALPKYDADELNQYLREQTQRASILRRACTRLAAYEKYDPIAGILKQHPGRLKAPTPADWSGTAHGRHTSGTGRAPRGVAGCAA
jgi:hypothetical protein